MASPSPSQALSNVLEQQHQVEGICRGIRKFWDEMPVEVAGVLVFGMHQEAAAADLF